MKLWQRLKECFVFNLKLFKLHLEYNRLTEEIWRLEDLNQQIYRTAMFLSTNDPARQLDGTYAEIEMRIRALTKDRHAVKIYRAQIKLQMYKKQADR